MRKDIKLVFMGTPEFASEQLKVLIDEFNVLAVITQQDKPRGRGNKLKPSPVKEVASQNSIEVLQPKKLREDREVIERIKALNPDFIIVVAYGQILSKEVLDIPRLGCINVHASLLPKYRGASPIQSAILNGEKISGNTTMLMDEGLDTGDILLQSKVDIDENMTYGELHDLLLEDGKKLIVKTIEELFENKLKKIKQIESEATYSGKINKKDEKLDFSETAEKVHNRIRGLNPIPLSYSILNGNIIKFLESEVEKENNKSTEEVGTILQVLKDSFIVKCFSSSLRVKKIQPQGKKPMNVRDFLNGNKLEVGDKFQ